MILFEGCSHLRYVLDKAGAQDPVTITLSRVDWFRLKAILMGDANPYWIADLQKAEFEFQYMGFNFRWERKESGDAQSKVS